MAPKETPPAPGRTAQIVAVASLTLAIAVTVAALTGRIGRKAEPPAGPAPAEAPALVPTPMAAEPPAGAVSTPGSPVGPLPAPQPILLVPVQPAADQVVEPALPPSPDDQVARWRGDDDDDDDDEREHHGRRHHEDDDDDDD